MYRYEDHTEKEIDEDLFGMEDFIQHQLVASIIVKK